MAGKFDGKPVWWLEARARNLAGCEDGAQEYVDIILELTRRESALIDQEGS